MRAWCAASRCPVLVVHGDDDQISPAPGHMPLARDPVKVNLLLREFVESLPEGRRP